MTTRNLPIHLLVWGCLASVSCSSAFCVEQDDNIERSVVLKRSTVPRSFGPPEGLESDSDAEEKTHSSLLPDLVQSSKTSVVHPVLSRNQHMGNKKNQGELREIYREDFAKRRYRKHPAVKISIEDFEERWYGKHPALKIFCVISGVALLGATSVFALSMVCTAFCAPELAVCLSGIFSNQTFGDCPTNQTSLLNGTTAPFVVQRYSLGHPRPHAHLRNPERLGGMFDQFKKRHPKTHPPYFQPTFKP